MCLELTRGGAPSWGLCEGLTIPHGKRFASCRMLHWAAENWLGGAHGKYEGVEECVGPPLWSSGQSFWLQIQRSRVRFPALPDFSE